jgi:hypothetical protein
LVRVRVGIARWLALRQNHLRAVVLNKVQCGIENSVIHEVWHYADSSVEYSQIESGTDATSAPTSVTSDVADNVLTRVSRLASVARTVIKSPADRVSMRVSRLPSPARSDIATESLTTTQRESAFVRAARIDTASTMHWPSQIANPRCRVSTLLHQ